jgi:hypothetical protein
MQWPPLVALLRHFGDEQVSDARTFEPRARDAAFEGITSDDMMPIQGFKPASTSCLLLWLSAL